MVQVPPAVRAKALAAGAGHWLDQLPALLAELERDWSIKVGPSYEAATEAYVAEATLGDGTPAVLKLLVPRDGNLAAHEITVLRLTAGAGCVRLLAADPARDALLLDRLGRPMDQLGLPFRQRLAILCSLAQQVWRPAPDCGLPTGADHARRLTSRVPALWEKLDRPCSAAAVEHALACADRRIAGHDEHRAVLVHGDIHQWNALQSADGFALIDPDGLLAEPEYDLGVLMREDPEELLRGDPYDRARWLATRTGLDPVAIWEWGVVQRVAAGLILTQVGLQPVARQMLATADHISVLPPTAR